MPAALPMARTPFFCSGCPHNLSTRAGEIDLVGAGIGCHSLVALDPAHARGHLIGAPQMGGEGAQWIGMAPFTDDRHYRQNLGDGTFHHSGSLAIRAAVAAGVSVTYRLLYNDAVAMTGGQTAPGRMGVVDLVRWLEIEGVRRVIITTEDPAAFEGVSLPAFANVRHRDALHTAQEELAGVPGVTVLLHTDRCATEERRLRKRGKLPVPEERVWINERVCEGCGDCGRKSSCLSVIPTVTEFGRKTRIHQSSCTQDFACVEGDCPAFVLVTPSSRGTQRSAPPEPPVALTEPEPIADHAAGVLIRMPGIGGTGVVTVSQILQVAAMLDGKHASGLDQTGLAQKGGAVISDVRITPEAGSGAVRAAGGEVDVLLGLDLLGIVTADTLRALDPSRTVAVVNLDQTPTAAMVTDPSAPPIPVADVVARIDAATRADKALWLDAGDMADRLFADHMPTNMIMLGAAFQHGCLPVTAAALERAIELNGAGVPTNLAAFRWGRATVVDRLAVETALGATSRRVERRTPPIPGPVADLAERAGLTGEVRDVAVPLACDLVDYQDVELATDFLTTVARVARSERQRIPDDDGRVTVAFARGLHKLTAYKDEYEVARLHLDTVERAKRDDAFGPDAQAAVLLHPPLLRALGLKRKLRLRRSATPTFRVLRAARRLRGTRLDIFGYARLRRIERELVGDYRASMDQALQRLSPTTLDSVLEIAALPDMVRGYEEIKLDNIDRYRARLAALLERLDSD